MSGQTPALQPEILKYFRRSLAAGELAEFRKNHNILRINTIFNVLLDKADSSFDEFAEKKIRLKGRGCDKRLDNNGKGSL